MAEEKGSASGKANGKTAIKSCMSPSVAIVKSCPQGIVELSLRGANVVLALISLITAVVCEGSLRVFLPTHPLVSRTNAGAGWIIFLSFFVMLYQLVAILLLFLRIKIFYKVVSAINWSIFFLMDIIAIGLAAGGYLCGGIPMAVYAKEWNAVITVNIEQAAADRVSYAAAATSAFSLFTFTLSVGMIIYFFFAHYVLKWSTHGEPSPKGQSSSTG